MDPTADIVIAAEQLARAIARAKPAERDAAAARMDRLALPAPGDAPVVTTALRSIRAVLAPPAPPPERPRIASIAFAVLARIEARPRLRRAAELVRARVRALAA